MRKYGPSFKVDIHDFVARPREPTRPQEYLIVSCNLGRLLHLSPMDSGFEPARWPPWIPKGCRLLVYSQGVIITCLIRFLHLEGGGRHKILCHHAYGFESPCQHTIK